MLQMECPNCEVIISSPFLAEISYVRCKKCDIDVSVQGVFVSTKAFTMSRDTLLKRVTHYRSLLKKIAREKDLSRKGFYKEEKASNSLDQLYNSLQELMEGARDNYRMPIPQGLPLGFEFNGRTYQGKLINLSTKGAGIKADTLNGTPIQNSSVALQMTLSKERPPVAIKANVAWAGSHEVNHDPKNISIGVSFNEIDTESHQAIWNYLVNNEGLRI
jgi:hypothetical protein